MLKEILQLGMLVAYNLIIEYTDYKKSVPTSFTWEYIRHNSLALHTLHSQSIQFSYMPVLTDGITSHFITQLDNLSIILYYFLKHISH